MQSPNKFVTKPSLMEKRPAIPATAGITAMIALMNELVQVMSQEAEFVGSRNQKEHALLLKRKQRLTVDYRAGMKSIASEPEKLKDLPVEIRAALKVAAQKLADVTDRNARMLRTAVMATQRLIQNIVSMVKQEALAKTTYSNPATAHLSLGTYSPTCKPVAISRTA